MLKRVCCIPQRVRLGHRELHAVSPLLVKRFWDNVDLHYTTSDRIDLQINGKTINTPIGNALSLSTHREPLAYLVKKEWENIAKNEVNPFLLPLTSLTARCIDFETVNKGTNHDLQDKIGANVDTIANSLLRYLDSDTLLVFAPRNELEGKLRSEQNRLYLPIIKSIEILLNEEYGDQQKDKNRDKHEFTHLSILDADIHGIRGNMQPDRIKEAALRYINSLTMWELAIFEKITTVTKSFICGMLLIENKSRKTKNPDLQISVDDIIRATTLETIHQTERWGEVEDTHDINRCEMYRNVLSAAIVAY